jgi:hypothetical protein
MRTLCVIFMRKILPLILVLGLFSCSRLDKQSENKMTDSSSLQTPAVVNEYELASVYQNLDSDSLLVDKVDFVKFLGFLKEGTRIKEMEYEGGDCGGKFRQMVLGGDTLTIDKYGCGDYGFGNTEFVTQGDSLRYVREYKMEWSPDDKGNVFDVSESVYEFSAIGSTKRTRTKSIKGWKDFRINDKDFEEIRLPGQSEYFEFKKELKELVVREKMEE